MQKKISLYNLLLSKWSSTFGAFLQATALPLVIFDITGSSALLSWTFFAETLPWLLLGPFITNILVMRVSSKSLYMICNFSKGICTLMLAVWIDTSFLIVSLFFVLGIFNAVSASVYSALLRDNSNVDNLDKILGLSLGIDDVVSIVAPVCVTFIIGKGFDGIIFLYANGGILITTVLLCLKIHSKGVEAKRDTLELKETLNEIVYNYTFLRSSNIGYLVLSECFRSFVEGMIIPLLVIYAVNTTESGQELFAFGNIVMAISQVMMSFIYIYLKKIMHDNFIINIGATLISGGLLMLFFWSSKYIYCVSMLLMGLGMALRQLISENILISKFKEEKLSKIVSVYNSLISLAYLAGYMLSAFQPYLASVRVYLFIGGISLIIPIWINIKQKVLK